MRDKTHAGCEEGEPQMAPTERRAQRDHGTMITSPGTI